MIIDNIENAHLYNGISPRIKLALDFIKENNLNTFKNGKYEIDNDNVFAIVQDYNTKNLSEGKWEAHKKYTDIQFIIKGEENIGYLNIDKFSADTEFNEEKDIVFGSGNGSLVKVEENSFMILTPKDAHMPGICTEKPSYVKKAVIKILL